MPKLFKRNCDYCGAYYEKQNAMFCSRNCRHNATALCQDNNTEMSDELHSTLEGVLFSDGNLRMQSNAYFRFAQCEEKKEYVYLLANKFGVLPKVKTRDIFLKGKTYRLTQFETRSNHTFTKYYHRWYPSGRKIIPSDFKINPISLYHLYIGDGCLDLLSNSPRYRVRIATCSFDKKCIENVFMHQLANFRIFGTIQKNNIVEISKQDSVKRFFDLMCPSTLGCFDYKFRCIKDTGWLNRFLQ
jgi:hypothetical protein